jgi:hypothetical protein
MEFMRLKECVMVSDARSDGMVERGLTVGLGESEEKVDTSMTV